MNPGNSRIWSRKLEDVLSPKRITFFPCIRSVQLNWWDPSLFLYTKTKRRKKWFCSMLGWPCETLDVQVTPDMHMFDYVWPMDDRKTKAWKFHEFLPKRGQQKKRYFSSNMAILTVKSRRYVDVIFLKITNGMLPHIIIFNASDSLREACFKQWTCHEIGARFFFWYMFLMWTFPRFFVSMWIPEAPGWQMTWLLVTRKKLVDMELSSEKKTRVGLTIYIGDYTT